MPLKVGKTEIPEHSGPGWYDRVLELAILVATGYFIYWAMNVFIDLQIEPYALIALVTALAAGTESIIYLNRRKREDTIREVIKYERDFTSGPIIASAPDGESKKYEEDFTKDEDKHTIL